MLAGIFHVKHTVTTTASENKLRFSRCPEFLVMNHGGPGIPVEQTCGTALSFESDGQSNCGPQQQRVLLRLRADIDQKKLRNIVIE